jgi:heme oxygenase
VPRCRGGVPSHLIPDRCRCGRRISAANVSAVPEGAALGAAFLGRLAAGLEASTERVVEPHPAWAAPMQQRYGRLLELADEH